MPRAPRHFVESGHYHVFVRGSNRQAIFELDTDRIDFLACLRRAFERHEVQCLAYCLMTNHYHLLVETPGMALSQAMRELNGRYSLRFNRRNGRDAHLFKNRFGALFIEDQAHLLATVRYIARNPVEQGLCARADEWRWSSHRACLGLDMRPPFLAVDGLAALLGTATMAESVYRELVGA